MLYALNHGTVLKEKVNLFVWYNYIDYGTQLNRIGHDSSICIVLGWRKRGFTRKAIPFTRVLIVDLINITPIEFIM